MIKSIVFDIDGTLLDTEYAVLNSLKDTIYELKKEIIPITELKFSLGIPGEVTLEQLGIDRVSEANKLWNQYMKPYSDKISLFDGAEKLIKELKSQGYQLGIITSKSKSEYKNDFSPFGLDEFFDIIICVEDSQRPKPSPDPMLKYLEVSGAKKEEVIYIGDTHYDMQCATEADVAFGLALWGCKSVENIYAAYYFNSPEDILYSLSKDKNRPREASWIKYARELQFLAQGGLAYSKDPYDIERFERIREISAEMISSGSGYSVDFVKDIFCNETGYQTPKLDTRAAIFKNDKILLVKEKDETWSLPGGWVDVNETIRSNTIKEVREEAGVDVVPTRIIAIQEKNLHNPPQFAHGVAKVFVLCEFVGGKFTSNMETVSSGYFGLDELPFLSDDKNTEAQIKMCFEAYYSTNWNPIFD